MKNSNTYEMNLIRSRALRVLVSMVLSALILFPIAASATDKKKPEESGTVYMQALKQQSLAAVSIINIEDDKYELSIESHDGESVFFNENYSSIEDFSKIFDFSSLKNGEYTFKVIGDNSETERHFTMSNGKVQVKYSRLIEPTFSKNGLKAQIEFSEKLDNDVVVAVYSPEGEELYSKTMNKNSTLKQFDFSKVNNGEYKLVVYTQEKDYDFVYQK